MLSRRNGLSRQTTGGWLADAAKARAVGLVLGTIAAACVLACQRAWPDGWPLPAWAAGMVVLIALSVLWPVLLLPLFMKSEPLRDGPLADALWQTVRTSRRAGARHAAAAHGREDLGRKRHGGRPRADRCASTWATPSASRPTTRRR